MADSKITIKITIENLNVYYGNFPGLINVNMKILDKAIIVVIRPSSCGKSTFLRSLNWRNELIDGAEIQGKILLDGKDIYKIDVFQYGLSTA